MFHTASEEEIKAGKVSDVYFSRTMEALKSRGVDKQVVAEVWTKGLPHDWEWGVLAGVEECIELLKGRPVSLRGLSEGSVFRAFEPVLEIEGHYLDFALLETALLGLICQSSGVATAAARCKKGCRGEAGH